MKQLSQIVPRAAVVAFGLVLGCAGPAAVDPAVVEATEQQVLAPFEVEQTIVADDLVLSMTANFYHLVQRRLNPAVHEVERKPRADGGTDYEFRNRVGDSQPIRLVVLGTTFGVLKTARISVLGGRHAFTLDAAATGEVTLVRDDVTAHSRSVQIKNGSFLRR